jgi:hypothetical protein
MTDIEAKTNNTYIIARLLKHSKKLLKEVKRVQKLEECLKLGYCPAGHPLVTWCPECGTEVAVIDEWLKASKANTEPDEKDMDEISCVEIGENDIPVIYYNCTRHVPCPKDCPDRNTGPHEHFVVEKEER